MNRETEIGLVKRHSKTPSTTLDDISLTPPFKNKSCVLKLFMSLFRLLNAVGLVENQDRKFIS